MTVDAGSILLPLGSMLVFVFGVVGLLMTAVWVWSLVDALRISDQRWAAAGENKVLWVVLIAILGLLGSTLYVAMPRPKLGRTTG